MPRVVARGGWDVYKHVVQDISACTRWHLRKKGHHIAAVISAGTGGRCLGAGRSSSSNPQDGRALGRLGAQGGRAVPRVVARGGWDVYKHVVQDISACT